MKKLKVMLTVFVACLVMFMAVATVSAPNVVMADTTEESSSTEQQTKETDYETGDPNDIVIGGVYTQSARAGEVAGIAFTAELDKDLLNADGSRKADTEILSVRPKMDTAGPFVIDNAMYAIEKPDGDDEEEEKKALDAGFMFNVKGDIKTAYYPIAFEIEYKKDDKIYRIDKSIDISLFGNEEETTTSTEDANTSVPRIIVTGFKTNPEKVMAGEEFELTVTLQNTSNKTSVSNIKVSMSTAGNEFLPSSGSSTEFIRSMGCGATKDITIKMKAQSSLEQKPYVLSVDCEYEGEKNAPYTAKESISIPVYQEAKAKITNVEVMPDALEMYSQSNIMFSINNTGKSTLYNVQVMVDESCTTVEASDSFVGNIQPGSTGYADFMVTGIAPTMDDGIVKIIISYEDASGEVGTFETEVNLFVYEPYVEEFTDEMMYPDDMEMMEEESQTPGWLWIAIGVGVVIVVIIVTVVIIKNKKRRRLEEELEDEIS